MSERSSTIREVAKLANVSVGTISNFLNDNKPISPPTRDRIQSAIDQLGFIPNSAVRVMRGARSHAIGFVIPDAANPFLTEVARGIEDVAISAGDVVVTCNTNGDPDREDHYARALSEMRVVGAVVMAMSTSESHLLRLEASGATVVILGSHDDRFASVDVDNVRGGYLAMRHLLERGHSNVVFIGGPGAAPQINERFAGSRQAFKEAGLNPDGLRRINANGNTTAARMEVASQVLEWGARPTAAFCANDLLALALEATLVRRGISIPRDFAIVGYDDIEAAGSAPIALTTIRQPQYELGRAAAEMVLKLVAGETSGENHVSFEPELVVREST